MKFVPGSIISINGQIRSHAGNWPGYNGQYDTFTYTKVTIDRGRVHGVGRQWYGYFDNGKGKPTPGFEFLIYPNSSNASEAQILASMDMVMSNKKVLLSRREYPKPKKHFLRTKVVTFTIMRDGHLEVQLMHGAWFGVDTNWDVEVMYRGEKYSFDVIRATPRATWCRADVGVDQLKAMHRGGIWKLVRGKRRRRRR